MRSCILLLTIMVILVGCKPEDAPAALRLVQTLVADPKSTGENRQIIGEVKPRYESDLSFRVGGKVLSRSLMSAPRSNKATRWRHSTLRIIGIAFGRPKRTSAPPRLRL